MCRNFTIACLTCSVTPSSLVCAVFKADLKQKNTLHCDVSINENLLLNVSDFYIKQHISGNETMTWVRFLLLLVNAAIGAGYQSVSRTAQHHLQTWRPSDRMQSCSFLLLSACSDSHFYFCDHHLVSDLWVKSNSPDLDDGEAAQTFPLPDVFASSSEGVVSDQWPDFCLLFLCQASCGVPVGKPLVCAGYFPSRPPKGPGPQAEPRLALCSESFGGSRWWDDPPLSADCENILMRWSSVTFTSLKSSPSICLPVCSCCWWWWWN